MSSTLRLYQTLTELNRHELADGMTFALFLLRSACDALGGEGEGGGGGGGGEFEQAGAGACSASSLLPFRHPGASEEEQAPAPAASGGVRQNGGREEAAQSV
jgi:hypothetical protein